MTELRVEIPPHADDARGDTEPLNAAHVLLGMPGRQINLGTVSVCGNERGKLGKGQDRA